jgi:hypothetical protein
LLTANSFFNRERKKNQRKREKKIQWTTREHSIRVEERSQLCVTTTRKDKLRQERSVDTYIVDKKKEEKIIIWSFSYYLLKKQ